jgi:hypothetical protein
MTADGKAPGATTLLDKLNVSEFKGYKATTAAEYQKRLEASTTYDLCDEAARVGIRPDAGNRKRVIHTLMDAYRKAHRGQQAALAKAPQLDADPEKGKDEAKKQQDLKEFLSFVRK